ncbi:MAG TPA: hypothetical protein VKQ32_26780, partial [Polyangia bacterium]|nr:hypothetical protein [Polyangia bacterium]
MQIRVRRIDEDRDRREVGDARGTAGLGGAQDGLLGDAVGLRVEANRCLELDEAVGRALLILVHLGEQRVRLD